MRTSTTLPERASSAMRTVTVIVPEAEWRAFAALEPNPVGWLRLMIRQRIEGAARPETAAPTRYAD